MVLVGCVRLACPTRVNYFWPPWVPRFCKGGLTCLSFTSVTSPCADESQRSNRTPVWCSLECYQSPPLPGSIRPFESRRSVCPHRTGIHRTLNCRSEPHELGFLYNQVDGTNEVAPKPFTATGPHAMGLWIVALPQVIWTNLGNSIYSGVSGLDYSIPNQTARLRRTYAFNMYGCRSVSLVYMGYQTVIRHLRLPPPRWKVPYTHFVHPPRIRCQQFLKEYQYLQIVAYRRAPTV